MEKIIWMKVQLKILSNSLLGETLLGKKII